MGILSRSVTSLMLTISLVFFSQAHATDIPLQFSGVSGKPIIVWTEFHGGIRDQATRPMLSIFADGRVQVYLAPYMKGAGHYEYRLSLVALNELLEDFARLGVMTFDAEAVRSQREAIVRSKPEEVLIVADSTLTRIELNFERFAQSGELAEPLSSIIEYKDLAIDAKHFSQIKALPQLNSARDRMLGLIQHQNFDALPITGGQ